MARNFESGDFLLFQLESGFGLLRVLMVDAEIENDPVWHLLAYEDLFLDLEMAEAALKNPNDLSVSIHHLALTNRAFERTPTAKLMNLPVSDDEFEQVRNWQINPESKVTDRSVLLMLGLR